MNAKIILFVNANVISFVTTLQSKRIHKCNCNRISRHTDPMCNIIRILQTRLQQQTQLAYPPRAVRPFDSSSFAQLSPHITLIYCILFVPHAVNPMSHCSTACFHFQRLIVVSSFFSIMFTSTTSSFGGSFVDC